MSTTFDGLRIAIAERYAIERELGSGGMATVFLAEDLKHHRKVAVKVLRPELAATLGVERFLREIEIAAGLNHPHILQLHDSGQAGGFLYFVMPYVEETLRTKLERDTQISETEAVRITRTVAAALDYAHKHNIVHRDVKPENILLHEGEPMVTDFGIARAISAAGGTTLTQTGLPIGTPRYMSPEQAMGSGDLDGRTDVFSLGIVLYEMLVGEPPQTPADRLSVSEGRLTDTPTGHRRRLEALPRPIVQALSRSLADHPADRFNSAKQFAKALAPPKRGPVAWIPWQNKAIVAAISTTVLLAVAIAAWLVRRAGETPIVADRVLVAGIQNETGDSTLNPLGKMVADRLTLGLEETGLVEVVDARAVAADPLGSDSAGRQGAALGMALAQQVGAGMVLSGAYYLQADSVQFQIQITGTESGTLLSALDPVSGTRTSPLDALDLLQQRVMGTMATLLDDTWPRGVSSPPTFAAYREYVAGVPLIGQDFAGAITHFLQASALDPTFTWPLIYATGLMVEGGQFARADSMIEVIYQFRDRLRTPELRTLDYLAARLQGDLVTALSALQEAAAIAPLSESTWEIAQLLLRLNRPSEAIELFVQLDPAKGFLENRWFYWKHYGAAHHMLGDHVAELAVARRGRNQYPDHLGALSTEVVALAALGHLEQLDQRLDEAAALTPQAGFGTQMMTTLIEAAEELWAHGEQEGSADILQRLHDWAENRPADQTETVEHRAHLAIAAYLAGRWDDARQRFAELAAEHPGNVSFRAYLGTTAARLGDRTGALAISDWLQQLEQPYLFGVNTVWQARIAALLDEPDRAVALLTDAFDDGIGHMGTELTAWGSRTSGAWLHRDIDFDSLRGHTAFEELLRPKG
ncbi:MAG: protein kinase [Gemmatimonadota bacterium]|nr:MAG: protein kinase [Gemmatimonadota bacterium]